MCHSLAKGGGKNPCIAMVWFDRGRKGEEEGAHACHGSAQ